MMSLSSPNGRPTILVADSDVFSRNLLSRELSRDGYFVLGAANYEEAIALSRKFADRIHLVVSNFDLPDIASLTEGIVRDRPGIRVMVMSPADHSGLIEARRVRGKPPGGGWALPEVLHSDIRRMLSDTESGDAAEE